MGVFVRAVVTGFGFSLGAALFRRVSSQLGLEDAPADQPQPTTHQADGEPETDDGNDAAHIPA